MAGDYLPPYMWQATQQVVQRQPEQQDIPTDLVLEQSIGPVANAQQYANSIGFQREAPNIDSQKELGKEFYTTFKDWKIATPVIVEKGKPSVVTLQSPTGEIKKFELNGDLNLRSLNPGNVGTTGKKIGTGPVGKTLEDLFTWTGEKTFLSSKKFPLQIRQNPEDTYLTVIPNSEKQYLDKNLKELVQTYLPEWVPRNGVLEHENPNQKHYYNKVRSNLKMAFNINLPTWENADESSTTIKDILQVNGKIDPDRVKNFTKFLMTAEGGKLKRVKELK